MVTRGIDQRIIFFERKCYRKPLRIVWTQKVTNTDVHVYYCNSLFLNIDVT